MDTLATCAYTFDYWINNVNNKPKINVYAVFLRDKSWMREKRIEILQHEQGHFDIAQIYALRAEKKVNDSNHLAPREYIMFINESMKQTEAECNEQQNKYDSWTMNTLGREHYYKWIREQLDSLGAYK